MMTERRFYIFLSLACLAGYIWLAWSLEATTGNKGNETNVCLVRLVTGIPCPSCGSTRSVMSLMKGDLYGSLSWNPFGLILMVILVVSPVWMLSDALRKKTTLFSYYNRVEYLFKQKYVAIPAVLFVLANWAWNIYKGL